MTTPKPSWVKDGYTSYEDIVSSWGWEILAFDTHGSYQGDISVLLRSNDRNPRYGFLVIGYGSCSGCDALESLQCYSDMEDWSEIVDFSNNLMSSVHVESSASEMSEYLLNLDKGNEWYLSDEDIKTAIIEYADQLELGVW